MSSRKDKANPTEGQIRLTDAEPQQDLSQLALYTLDASGKVLSSTPLDKEGRFKLAADVRGARRVAIAPVAEKGEEPNLANAVEFHAADFARRVSEGVDISVQKDRWGILFPHQTCVSGSVSACWYPWLLSEAASVKFADFSLADLAVEKFKPGLEIIGPPIFKRCSPVCNALVEVYRRFCCCRPWIYLDPRIELLKRRLKEIVDLRPVFPFPPGPDPDPPFIGRAQPLSRSFAQSAAASSEPGVDEELAANASADLRALQTLPAAEVLQYVNARPYLLWPICTCGPAVRVGQDFVHPDGTFNVCWPDPIFVLLPGCHMEYAFKVKQLINGVTVTIYNGVASGRWFDQTSGINLVSYDRRAITCHTDPSPVDYNGAYVMLQDIGITGTYRLSSPSPDGAFSVGAPGPHSGLLDADASDTAPGKNSNWGGTLRLRIHFSNVIGASMKALGARYYRVSVSAANAAGNPTGSRTYYHTNLGWLYYNVDPITHIITTEEDPLGPVTRGTQSNLYKIPYDNDRDWQDGQWHAFINTADFPDGQYLITIEVFDNGGIRLVPNGVPTIDGTDQHKSFVFLKWNVRTGPGSTEVVPYAALTNYLWWDNRPPYSEIVSLVGIGGTAADCQFLSGSGSATIAVEVKAYHPQALFIADRTLKAYRGIHDTTGNAFGLPPVNFAAPTAAFVSDTKTVDDLLGPTTTKCSFALVLKTWAKTTDGIWAVWGPAEANGAFALEKV